MNKKHLRWRLCLLAVKKMGAADIDWGGPLWFFESID